MRKLQIEMRELDFALHSMMKDRVPSMELNRRLLQNEINSQRFKHILQEASKTGLDMNSSLLLPRGGNKGTLGDEISDIWPLNLHDSDTLNQKGSEKRDINPVDSNVEESEKQMLKSHLAMSPKRLPAGSKTLLASQSNTPLNTHQAGPLEGALTHTQHSSDWETLSHGGNTTAVGLLGSDSDRNANQPASLGVNKEPVRHKAVASYCPAIPPHLSK